MQLDENVKAISDEKITDKFKLYEISTDGEYVYPVASYGIVLVTEGKGMISNVPVKQGDRLFVPENENSLCFSGKIKSLFCTK